MKHLDSCDLDDDDLMLDADDSDDSSLFSGTKSAKLIRTAVLCQPVTQTSCQQSGRLPSLRGDGVSGG